MADRFTDTLLDLDTLIERPAIAIDGARHEIVSPDEISVIDTQRLASLGRKLDNLMKQEGDAQSKVLTDTLEAIVGIVMAPVPPDIRSTLSDQQKRAVIEVFTTLSLGLKLKRAGATIPQIIKAVTASKAVVTKSATATGEKPSPGSSASMAATPQAG